MSQHTLYSSMEELSEFVKNSVPQTDRSDSKRVIHDRCDEHSRELRTDPELPPSLIKSILEHPELKAYQLCKNDLYVIANMFYNAGKDYITHYDLSTVLEFVPDMISSIQVKIKYAQSLVDRHILSLCYTPDLDFHHDITEFLQSRFHLNGFLWNILLGKSPLPGLLAKLKTTLSNYTSFQDAVCDVLDQLYDYYPELSERIFKLRGIYYGHQINILLDLALDYLSKQSSEHPFRKLCNEHVPDAFWQRCLLLIYRYYRRGDDLEIPALAVLMSHNEEEYQQTVLRLRQDNLLVRNKILDDNFGSYHKDCLEVSEEGIAWLSSKSVSTEPEIAVRVEQSEYFELINPVQDLSRLILPDAVIQSIRAIINRLQNPDTDILQSWGLHTASLCNEQDIQGACNVLLHGEPGTGKTYIAGVIANELKRPLIKIDASNIRNCYYGKTEKRAKEMFREMQDLAKHYNPVFLLNEGDQLVHHRLQGQTSGTDNAENSIQSIFLEALETFTGVLILTSNLIQNLDPALSRRFHYKLQIPAPELPERIKLWKIHLPASIPGAEEIDIYPLAENFCFTGGQISTVVLNACHHAASRNESRILLFNDLWHYANLENGSSFESRKRLVGF